MLTFEQCKKLKEWGLREFGNGKYYHTVYDPPKIIKDMDINTRTSCIYIPTLEELKTFAIDLCKEKWAFII